MNARLPLPALLLGLLSLAAAPRPPLRDVSDFETRIAKINTQIHDLKAKIADAEKKESSILSELDRIGLRKGLIRAELAADGVAIERTNGELGSLRKDIARRRAALESERRSVEKTLVTLYKFGRFDFLKFALRSENIESFFAESKHLAFLARHQKTSSSATWPPCRSWARPKAGWKRRRPRSRPPPCGRGEETGARSRGKEEPRARR